MFAPPPAIETEVFATLPDELRDTAGGGHLAPFLGRDCDSFLEGPSFDRLGNLYCVDIAAGRILRVGQDGAFDVVIEYDGQPNGLKIHRDGRLFVADRRLGILAVDPASPKIKPVLPRFDLEPFRGPNDLVFSAGGDLYFTDQGMSDLAHPTGRVFRLSQDGSLEVLLDGLPGPNGIAFDASGRELYVALTRANSVIRAILLPDGRLSRVSTLLQLSGAGGPDGLAADHAGGLAVAHPMMGAVWLFDAKGQPALRVDLCLGSLGTNIAYDGPDGRRLYITESETGTVQVADLPAAGVTMYSHQGDV